MEPATTHTFEPPNDRPDAPVGGNPVTAEHGIHSAPSADTGEQVSPPYWQAHVRNNSVLSYTSIGNGAALPIQLEDHTLEGSEQNKALWARHVTVDDYVVVSGTVPGAGAYVVWNCTVETLNGGPMKINKRYSEFDLLRAELIKSFPQSESAIPPLPRKSFISRYRPEFLEKRRVGLANFLNCVLLNPEFSGSPILKDFLFG